MSISFPLLLLITSPRLGKLIVLSDPLMESCPNRSSDSSASANGVNERDSIGCEVTSKSSTRISVCLGLHHFHFCQKSSAGSLRKSFLHGLFITNFDWEHVFPFYSTSSEAKLTGMIYSTVPTLDGSLSALIPDACQVCTSPD